MTHLDQLAAKLVKDTRPWNADPEKAARAALMQAFKMGRRQSWMMASLWFLLGVLGALIAANVLLYLVASS